MLHVRNAQRRADTRVHTRARLRPAGIVNAGFLLHEALALALAALTRAAHAAPAPAPGQRAWRAPPMAALARAAACAAVGAASAAVVAAPLVLHQAHARAAFCYTSAADPAPAAVSVSTSTGAAALGGPSPTAGLRMAAGLAARTLWRPDAPWLRAAAEPAPAHPLPAWCGTAPWWRPSVYGHVQAQYWGVGLLKYWRVQQVRGVQGARPRAT